MSGRDKLKNKGVWSLRIGQPLRVMFQGTSPVRARRADQALNSFNLFQQQTLFEELPS